MAVFVITRAINHRNVYGIRDFAWSVMSIIAHFERDVELCSENSSQDVVNTSFFKKNVHQCTYVYLRLYKGNGNQTIDEIQFFQTLFINTSSY